MKKEGSRPEYVSFLLRMWREDGADAFSGTEERPIWRASIVSTLTGRRRGFASLDDLFSYLRDQERTTADDEPGRHPGGSRHDAPDATGP